MSRDGGLPDGVSDQDIDRLAEEPQDCLQLTDTQEGCSDRGCLVCRYEIEEEKETR